MDLRDQLAARFAAALVDAFPDPERIARRAYDLAEAMLSERARRIDADEQRAIAMEPQLDPRDAPLPDFHGALLDEPEPILERDEDLDPSFLEPPYDPSWDVELRLEAASSRLPGSDADQPRPGLTRTQPDASEIRRERSA